MPGARPEASSCATAVTCCTMGPDHLLGEQPRPGLQQLRYAVHVKIKTGLLCLVFRGHDTVCTLLSSLVKHRPTPVVRDRFYPGAQTTFSVFNLLNSRFDSGGG